MVAKISSLRFLQHTPAFLTFSNETQLVNTFFIFPTFAKYKSFVIKWVSVLVILTHAFDKTHLSPTPQTFKQNTRTAWRCFLNLALSKRMNASEIKYDQAHEFEGKIGEKKTHQKKKPTKKQI